MAGFQIVFKEKEQMHFAQSTETKAISQKSIAFYSVLPLCCAAGVHVNKRKRLFDNDKVNQAIPVCQ